MKFEIELNSNNEDAYILRGKIHVDFEKLKEACDDFKRAKDLGHPQAEEYLNEHCQ